LRIALLDRGEAMLVLSSLAMPTVEDVVSGFERDAAEATCCQGEDNATRSHVRLASVGVTETRDTLTAVP
jgi:hypothetical protein